MRYNQVLCSILHLEYSYVVYSTLNVDPLGYLMNEEFSGHDVNFCIDLPCRASEIQFSLALLQLSLAHEKFYVS